MPDLICMDCGSTFDSCDIKWVEEYRGEFWGMPAYETMGYCPHCGSDYIEDYKDPDEQYEDEEEEE